MNTYQFLERELQRYKNQQMYYREVYRAAPNKFCEQYTDAVQKAGRAYNNIVAIETLMDTFMSEAIEEFNYAEAVANAK